MPRKSDDLDFNIHVDPSCLSTPMDEEASIVVGNEEGASPLEEITHHDKENAAPEAPGAAEKESDITVENSVTPQQDEVTTTSESEPQDAAAEVAQVAVNETGADADVKPCEEPSSEVTEEDQSMSQPEDEGNTDQEPETGLEQTALNKEQKLDEDDEETPRASVMAIQEDQDASRRHSGGSDRKTSVRTEALIQAAARAVVAKIEKKDKSCKSEESSQDEPDADKSLLSNISDAYDDDHDMSYQETANLDSRRTSTDSRALDAVDQAHSEGEAGGDSSDPHDHDDDDVFSDRSPRSSLGSVNADGVSDRPDSSKSGDYKSGDYKSRTRDHGSEHSRSTRISGISEFSQFDTGSQLDDGEEYMMPTKTTPRHPFRTISDVRAMQMSSPAPSVFSTPRSAKKHGNNPQSVSRMGSPGVSAQYSPKGRPTPPRFRVKKESAPLVLLHCTLLPLRWTWAGILNEGHLDLDEATESGFKPSEELKALRDNWRILQDRMGDTVVERGILLPHPEADYEVLEERLLEALELPLRRRARILECGHYLGPSNVTEIDDEETDSEFEDDFASRADQKESDRDRKHWCVTCKHDIRYENLGPGRIFRVKVYASNGLMKAGAWGACWKEMERVDVEVEPIVEPAVQGELERLESWQAAEKREIEARAQEAQEARQAIDGDDFDFAERDDIMQSIEQDDFRHSLNGSVADQTVLHHRFSSPRAVQSPSPNPILHASSPPPPSGSGRMSVEPRERDGDRRRREEERLREIYGHQSPESHDGRTRASSRHVRQYSTSGQHGYSSPPLLDTAMALGGSHRRTDSRNLPYQDGYGLPSPPRDSRIDESGSPVRGDYRGRHQYGDSYTSQHQMPGSHSEQAYRGREEQWAHNAPQHRRRGDESLPELLLEAAKVLLRDRRNVAIAALSVMVVLFALKQPAYSTSGVSGVQEREAEIARSIYLHQQQQQQQQQFTQQEVASVLTAPVTQNPVVAEVQQAPIVEVKASVPMPEPPVISVATASTPNMEPEAASSAGQSDSAPVDPPAVKPKKKKTVRVYETVTETIKVTATEVASAAPEASVVDEEEEEEEVEIEVVTQTETVKLAATTQAATTPEAEAEDPKPEAPEVSDSNKVDADSEISSQISQPVAEDSAKEVSDASPAEQAFPEMEQTSAPDPVNVDDEL
ncbi:hypothetical protein PspLS_00954 [Pyricularia sp. CBS 133598]|nr:hypothetical protein PspLS_00954 [Pyricularia sp. CBS 133598]